MEQQKDIRCVKLQCRSRYTSGTYQHVPWLNISGDWLSKLGFQIGDHVQITIRERLLIIEPLKGEAKAAQELKDMKEALKTVL